jgi:DNA sulfur modification protein DndC
MPNIELKMAESYLAQVSLQQIITEVQAIYLSDDKPWVIGFSGGKDSSATLQLVWLAVAQLPAEKRTKTVHVITSDTRVEPPVIVDFITATHEKINRVAESKGLPIKAEMVMPTLDDSFWVNMIGKGYPAPSVKFRWCTERLKIKPANKFIYDSVARYGEVVVVLGIRTDESATRAQAMSLHEIEGSQLRRHTSLSNAFVYAPIEKFSVNDVWKLLLEVPSPWGNDNRDLLAMYRSAGAGECPLVIDKTTPSCGNSRFGCWVCTVVEKDSAMEAMVDNGEEWLEPLLDVRDFLNDTQTPEGKLKYRDHKRRGGKVSIKRDGSDVVRGPYTLETCKLILRKVLEAQESVFAEKPDRAEPLIGDDEIEEIRRIWRTERQDWEDSAPEIYREVTGKIFDWSHDDGPVFTGADENILETAAGENGVPIALLKKLLDTERQFEGMNRRAGLFDQLERVAQEDWRTVEEVLAEYAEYHPAEADSI